MTSAENSGKADFNDVYNAVDARAYYATLGAVQYDIPQHGANVFNRLIDAYPESAPTVLDLCCSYGVGGALVKTDLDLEELYTHYQKAAEEGLSPDELIKADLELLGERVRPDPPRVIGLDVAENATRYAVAIGALDDAFTENLEVAPPSAELVSTIREVDMITTTGGVGYVTERTFSRLLDSTPRTPWVAAFCLRTYDYEPIAEALAEHGLVTEKAEQSFTQRRFKDEAEQEWAIAEVKALGLDPTPLECDGHLYADFFLSRPEDAAAHRPLAELIPAVA